MRPGLFIFLLALFCWWPRLSPGQSREPSAGQFVKPPVAVNFKEALTFSDISLMVRTKLPESEIIQEISHRGLVSAIQGTEAKSLELQGSSPALLALLQDPRFVLTEAEVQNYRQRQEMKQAQKSGGLPSPNLPAPAAPEVGNAPVAATKGKEVEIPLDQFNILSIEGHPLRLGIHDGGGDWIMVKINNERPTKLQKAEGFDSRGDNRTFLCANRGGKVYYVNTSRAHMNMCIIWIEPN